MRNINIRLETTTFLAINQMASARGITFSHVLREVIAAGLATKLSGKNVNEKLESNADSHEAKGASAAIEALLLLRKVASSMNSEWPVVAHEAAVKRIQG